MKTELSDYITTQGVAEALYGARGMAEAGAEMTVQYYQVRSLTLFVVSVIVLGVMPISIHKWLNNDMDKYGDGYFFTLLVMFVIAIGSLITAICVFPAVMNPEGALIYKFLEDSLR